MTLEFSLIDLSVTSSRDFYITLVYQKVTAGDASVSLDNMSVTPDGV